MNKIIEQRVCLKFCAKETSCVDALKLLGKTYGVTVLSKTQAYEHLEKVERLLKAYLVLGELRPQEPTQTCLKIAIPA